MSESTPYISNFNKKEAKAFASKSSTEHFEELINESRYVSYGTKMIEIAEGTRNTLFYTILLKLTELIATAITKIPASPIFQIVHTIPSICHIKNSYKILTQNNDIDDFIDEMYFYRCCEESNMKNPECTGKVPANDVCVAFLGSSSNEEII